MAKRQKQPPSPKKHQKQKSPKKLPRPNAGRKPPIEKPFAAGKERVLKPVRKTFKKNLFLSKPGYLPLPEGHPPTVSLLRRMEEEFERSLGTPRVSVVVVNHDGVDFLWHCLFALKTQTCQPYEIILVDNASGDASVSFVKANYPQVKILECQENFGFAMGSNLGTKYATGDLVALLNNDAVVTPDWLARMVADFQGHWPQVGALASAVKSNKGVEDGQEDHWTLNVLGNPVEGFFEDPQAVFYPEGCSLMYARFLATDGPFDPDYFIYQEDVYLGWRFRLLNLQVRKAPDAKVFHEPGGTMSRFQEWKTVYYKTRNRWLNLFLFYEKGNLLKVFPWIVAEALGRLVKSLGLGFNFFLGNLFAVLWILTHPLAIHRKRKALQAKRKAGDGRILRYLSGRVCRDKGFFSRWLNFLSLAYCLVVGLEVMEFPGEN